MNFENPILVRELRQLVRGRTFFAIFVGALVVQLIAAWIILRFNSNSGTALFVSQFSVLGLAAGTIVPAWFVVRFMRERSDNQVNLIYITALTPAQIVTGKLLSVGAIAGMLAAATLPGMMMSALLGGIGILDVAKSLLFFLAAATALYTLCILLCVLNLGMKWLKGLIMLQLMTMLLHAIPFAGAYVLAANIDAAEFAAIVLLFFAATAALYVAAVAALMPEPENRMRLPRFVFTALFVLVMLCDYAFSRDTETSTNLIICAIFLSVFQISCERIFLGRRALRHTKTTFLGRLVTFPFSSGAASGLVWCTLNIALVAALNFALGQDIRVSAYDMDAGLPTLFLIALLSIFFGAVWNVIFRPFSNATLTGKMTFMLIAVPLTWTTIAFSMFAPGMTDPMTDFGNRLRGQNLCAVAAVFMLALLLLLSPYIVIAFLRFKRPDSKPVTAS